MSRLAGVCTIVTLLVMGCGKPSAAPGGVAANEAPAGSGAPGVTFQTADGWTIHADYAPVPGAKRAVILLHQRNGSAADWKPLLQPLAAKGIAALAIDQRGAGRSLGKANGPDAPWDTGPDIAAAIDWLRKKGFDPKHIGLVGASYGANNALLYAAAHAGVPAVALLSPGANYHGLQALPAASRYRGALLILDARDDSITGDGPAEVDRVAPGVHTRKTYPGDAHGTSLFDGGTDAARFVADYLAAHL